MKKIYGYLTNGTPVYGGEQFVAHMEAHADVKACDIQDALSQVPEVNGFFFGSVDLGYVVGINHCVEVNVLDDVRLMHRKGRLGSTPTVFGRKGEPTTLLTMGMCVGEDGNTYIFTAFCGPVAAKEPWDDSIDSLEELKESVAFWQNHALVYQPESY